MVQDGTADDELRALVQQRVAGFGFKAAAMSGTFLAFRLVMLLVHGNTAMVTHPSMLLHFGGAAAMLVQGLLCWRGKRSLSASYGIEAIGWMLSAACYQMMGAALPAILRPDLIVLMVLTLCVVIRSITVPSTAVRTVVLCALIGAPFIALVYSVYPEMPPDFVRLVAELWGAVPAVPFNTAAALSDTVWWVLVTAAAAAASHVIFGLRAEMRDVRRLGQYVLEEQIGEGGMGTVHRASHAMLQRPTAIKLLLPDRVGEHSLTRFEREVRLTAKLTHPNTVTVFDYGRTPEGVFYYAMELLDGATLAQVVQYQGALPASRVLRILLQAASALSEAHDIGLIHRDIKPANIMLCNQGGIPDTVKLLDFGLVKQIESVGSTSVTAANVVTGTPHYMSPEALRAPDAVDGRSDLYAVGAVAFNLLTGRLLFDGDTLVEICSHHLHTPARSPRELEPTVPAELANVVVACLAKEPADRPSSARSLLERLRAVTLDDTWSDRDAATWWSEHRDALAETSVEAVGTAYDPTLPVPSSNK